jgi:LacI family transcriptional regulator, galactose operon repressor
MATLKDVAKRAGVGLGTASRVIGGNGPVSQAAIRRVRKAVDELKFRPSHAARVLQKGQSQTLGVFVPLIQGSFYTPIIHAIYTAVRASGRQMVVEFGQAPESERQDALAGAEFLADRGCDGLIMMGTALRPADIDRIVARQPRLVLLNRSLPGLKEHCFNPDHRAAGAAAARALYEAGHRRLAVIEGRKTAHDNTLRMRGFRETLRRLGIDVDRIPCTRGDFSPESGREGARELLARGIPFSALFCANDEMAIGAISYLREAGVDVPGKCSVMGYDGIDLSALIVPPLTTVLIPWREVATSALHHLLNLCYGGALPVRRDIPPQVLWRSSVARLEP